MMNFAISRREFMYLFKVGKTKTFDLQKRGKLIPIGDAPGPRFFELEQALTCIAQTRGQPLPDQTCVESTARLIVDLRVKASAGKRLRKADRQTQVPMY